MDRELRKHCEKRKAALLAERALYEPDWRQVAEYVDPYAGQHVLNTNSGQRKLPSRAKIINSAAGKALRTMDAGFMGGHTSKSRAWFRLGVSDPKLVDQPDVKVWLDDETQAIRDTLARANFYTALPSMYHSRHLFGVGGLAVEEDEEDVVRFYPRSIGTYAIGVDKRGRCDSFYYSFRWTAHQIKQKFEPVVGERGLPQKVREALTNDKQDERFVIHCLIEPNPDAEDGTQGPTKRPYRQLYWLDGCGEGESGMLDWQGHYFMPTLAPRWGVDGNDTYGPSPALDALGDIKQLQYLEGKKLLLEDLMAEPPLSLPETLRHKSASLRPGAKTYVTPGEAGMKAEAIYTPDPRGLQAVMEDIAKVTERIEQAFFADLFRMLDYLDDRQRTAYEISERKEEKVAMLGPALESLTDELLDPVIEIVYAIRLRRGLVKPPPPALDGVPVKVEYTSILAQAQKAAETGTVERVIGFASMIVKATGDPSHFDKIDVDAALEAVHDMQGAPARMLRGDEAVAGIREGRAQQQQMAQMASMAPALKQGAEAMRAAGEAVPKDGSVLAGMGAAA